MATEKELCEAAMMLKENCTANYCDSCCFCADDGLCCIARCCPESWKIPKPPRWGKADVLMAKALKTEGATEVARDAIVSTILIKQRTSEDVVHVIGQMSFVGCFYALEKGETVTLDDIIKEAGDAEDDGE